MARRAGFTLIELLVVISIIALLSSVVLASVNAAREKGRVAAGRQFDSNIKHAAGDYLVGEWLFDDPGNPYVDSSGNSNNGSCIGAACPTATTGYNGRTAMSFDGNDVVLVGNSTSVNVSGLLTVSGWVKTNGGEGCVLQKGNVNSIEFGLCFGYSNPNLAIARPYHYNQQVVYPHGFSSSAWHFLAMTVGPEGTRLYVNGSLVGSNSNPLIASNSEALVIGRGGGSVGYQGFFVGQLDDVRLYSKTLTAGEVADVYAAEAPSRYLAVEVEM